jgi:hypothetical protein
MYKGKSQLQTRKREEKSAECLPIHKRRVKKKKKSNARKRWRYTRRTTTYNLLAGTSLTVEEFKIRSWERRIKDK